MLLSSSRSEVYEKDEGKNLSFAFRSQQQPISSDAHLQPLMNTRQRRRWGWLSSPCCFSEDGKLHSNVLNISMAKQRRLFSLAHKCFISFSLSNSSAAVKRVFHRICCLSIFFIPFLFGGSHGDVLFITLESVFASSTICHKMKRLLYFFFAQG